VEWVTDPSLLERVVVSVMPPSVVEVLVPVGESVVVVTLPLLSV
jgi:hypothetical protein